MIQDEETAALDLIDSIPEKVEEKNGGDEEKVEQTKNTYDKWVSVLKTSIVPLILLTSLVIAYGEYQGKQSGLRVERTFELIEQWETYGYRKQLVNFSRILEQLNEAGKAEISGLSLSSPELAVQSFVQNKLTSLEASDVQDIEDLFYFFNKISLCAHYDVCDGELTRTYFADTMTSFKAYLEVYIALKRQRVQKFNHQMDLFLGEKKR